MRFCSTSLSMHDLQGSPQQHFIYLSGPCLPVSFLTSRPST